MNPRPTTGLPRPMDLDGCLFAWDRGIGMPVMFEMPESPATYIMCFKTEASLRLFHQQAEVEFDSFKQIDDGQEFLESIPLIWVERPLKIGLDPYYTVFGTVRYLELQR